MNKDLIERKWVVRDVGLNDGTRDVSLTSSFMDEHSQAFNKPRLSSSTTAQPQECPSKTIPHHRSSSIVVGRRIRNVQACRARICSLFHRVTYLDLPSRGGRCFGPTLSALALLQLFQLTDLPAVSVNEFPEQDAPLINPPRLSPERIIGQKKLYNVNACSHSQPAPLENTEPRTMVVSQRSDWPQQPT